MTICAHCGYILRKHWTGEWVHCHRNSRRCPRPRRTLAKPKESK